MNRRIAMSAFSILSALALLGGGAFAAFTTSATSNGSTFSTANPLLKIANDSGDTPGTYQTQIPSPINVSGLVPGGSKIFKFWLKNDGGLTDGTLSLNTIFGNLGGNGASGNGGVLDTNLHVSLSCAGVGNVADTLFNNYEGSGQDVIGGSLAPQGETECTMTVSLPSGNSNAKGQTLNFDATFNGSVGN